MSLSGVLGADCVDMQVRGVLAETPAGRQRAGATPPENGDGMWPVGRANETIRRLAMRRRKMAAVAVASMAQIVLGAGAGPRPALAQAPGAAPAPAADGPKGDIKDAYVPPIKRQVPKAAPAPILPKVVGTRCNPSKGGSVPPGSCSSVRPAGKAGKRSKVVR